jgi:hypothetical protein
MTLQLVSPDEIWIEDSIPKKAGERIVSSGHKDLQAHWVVVLINRPYEQTRIQLHDLIREAFGIDSERELRTTVDAETPVDPEMPNEPLFGDGFNGFRAIGVPVTAIREYRIKTKQYNTHVRWWKSYSESEWRLIDGAPLFNKSCTILVVSRTDYSREWVWMHPGIPMPFTMIYDTTLVTDKEVTLIATLREKLKHPLIRYFVPSSGYTISSVLDEMTAIHDAAKNLPDSDSARRDP